MSIARKRAQQSKGGEKYLNLLGGDMFVDSLTYARAYAIYHVNHENTRFWTSSFTALGSLAGSRPGTAQDMFIRLHLLPAAPDNLQDHGTPGVGAC